MIADKLTNASTYYSLCEKIKKALEYLSNTDFESMENGTYDIDKDIRVILQEYISKPQSEGKLEAHRKFADIQYIVKGEEKIGYSELSLTMPSDSYNEEKDIIFLNGECDFIKAKAGDFLVFFPQDAHMPSIAANEPSYVKKAVVKIRVA